VTATLEIQRDQVWWRTRQVKILLVVAHVPFLALSPVLTVTGLENCPAPIWLVLLLAIPIAFLQLRHSLAVASGVLSRLWPVTLTILGVLVYAPLVRYGWDWAAMQWTFIASAAMLLEGRTQKVLAAAPIFGTAIWAWIDSSLTGGDIPTDIYSAFYWLIGLSAGALCLYGATQLARAVDTLFATRADLAELTVGQERLRVSRDLHDLLGQSLSAISLKGDLALRLLSSGANSAAESEISELTTVARRALHEIRQVVRGEHQVTFRGELHGAAELLAAASIAVDIDIADMSLPAPLDQLLGWAVREGITNMLRHSQAAACSIRAASTNGVVMLEIVNDRAGHPGITGTGIAGLDERARTLSGSVIAGPLGDGRFRIRVEVPGGLA
jgi:two-component system sensor histidine kinase DesK